MPVLWYEIDINVWVKVNPGDVVTRPLNSDINWGVCDSSDPDGHVAEIWLYDGNMTQLMGPSLECILEYTEQNHTPANFAGYLLVIDDQGAKAKLDFTYQTK